VAIGTPYAAATTVTSTATSNNDTITTTADVPQGDTLFIFVSTRLATETLITSITGAPAWVLPDFGIVSPTGGYNGRATICRLYAASGTIPNGTVLTVNYNQSPTRHQLSAFGVSGVANETPELSRITNFGFGGGSPMSLSTYGKSGDLAISIISHVGSGASSDSATPTSGFTEYQDGPSNATTPFLHQYVEYQILGSTGTVTSSPTFVSDTGNILGVFATFREAPALFRSTLFDEAGDDYLTAGPYSDGPLAFFEDRNFSAPPAVAAPTATPQNPLIVRQALNRGASF